MRSALGILLMTILTWNYYDHIFSLLRQPFDQVATADSGNILALTGVTSGLALQLRIAVVGGIILSSPIWLFQLWRFVAPGLHKRERKWAYVFTLAAVPLFITGCWLGYAILPSTLEALYSFTPENVENVTNIDSYISFTLHLTLFFGLGFVIPILFVMLNFAGILSGRTIWKSWRWVIVGAFFFGAIATPNGDPVGMTIIALPMMALAFVAASISSLNDKRRRKSELLTDRWADDEASPLDA